MKKIKYLVFSLICLLSVTTNVYAASVSMKVTSNSMTIGNSVTVSTTFSSNSSIFFTEGTLKCSGAGVNGSTSLTFDNTSNNVYSKTFSYKVNPTTTGKVTCTTSGTKIIDASNGNWQSIGSKSVTITVNSKPSVTPAKPTVKSSNNYLTSLSIEEYELESKFDKEVLEYNVTLDPEVEKIKINAQLADSNATITGTGEKEVSTGLNTFEIVVMAENGSKRTYKLNVTVKDYNPIKVKVDKVEYTVIRKAKDLPKISEYFEEKEIKIGEETVEGYYNGKLDYNLVGLKDTNGKIEYYIYENNEYTKYKEYTFNGITLQITDKKVEGEVKKANFSYDGDKISGYQNVKLDIIKNTYALDNNDIKGNQFYLFYAINLDSGKEELYQYDAKEKTIQRFNIELLEMYKDRSDTYYMYLLGSILLLGLVIIIFSIITISRSKKNKKKNKKKNTKKISDEFEGL